ALWSPDFPRGNPSRPPRQLIRRSRIAGSHGMDGVAPGHAPLLYSEQSRAHSRREHTSLQERFMPLSEESLHEPLKFAYWVPNVSGGLVTSDIEQRTDWGYDYNRELAVLAENNGFEYALSQVRYTASYGAAYQHESTGFSLALLLATQRLKVI